MRLSVTQIQEFIDCNRMWFYDKILKLEAPQHPSAVLGQAGHTEVEHYYRTGELPNRFQWPMFYGPARMFLLPPGTVKLTIEFVFNVNITAGISLTGRIDLINESGTYLDSQGKLQHSDIIEIQDHKFSGAPSFWKSASDLRTNIQMMGYAEAVASGAPFIRLSHHYYGVKPPYDSQKPTTVVTGEQVRAFWDKVIVPTALRMRDVAAIDDVEKTAVTRATCTAYGGCYYGKPVAQGGLGKCSKTQSDEGLNMSLLKSLVPGAVNGSTTAKQMPSGTQVAKAAATAPAKAAGAGAMANLLKPPGTTAPTAPTAQSASTVAKTSSAITPIVAKPYVPLPPPDKPKAPAAPSPAAAVKAAAPAAAVAPKKTSLLGAPAKPKVGPTPAEVAAAQAKLAAAAAAQAQAEAEAAEAAALAEAQAAEAEAGEVTVEDGAEAVLDAAAEDAGEQEEPQPELPFDGTPASEETSEEELAANRAAVAASAQATVVPDAPKKRGRKTNEERAAIAAAAAASGGSTTAEPGAAPTERVIVEGPTNLFLDCRRAFDTGETGYRVDLAEYVHEVVEMLMKWAVEQGQKEILDIRCAEGQHPFAFGKWKGYMTAMFKDQPPDAGDWYLYGSGSNEMYALCVESLAPIVARRGGMIVRAG